MRESFSMKDLSTMQRWADSVTEYIKSSHFRYVIAFDGLTRRENIQNLMQALEKKIKEYEPSLADVTKKIYFLSLQEGEIHDFRPATHYLR